MMVHIIVSQLLCNFASVVVVPFAYLFPRHPPSSFGGLPGLIQQLGILLRPDLREVQRLGDASEQGLLVALLVSLCISSN